MFQEVNVEQQLDSYKYQVVVLVNSKEIIVKNFKSEENSPYLTCNGIFSSNNFGNNWIELAINKANILYVRDLFESEKRIVSQAEG